MCCVLEAAHCSLDTRYTQFPTFNGSRGDGVYLLPVFGSKGEGREGGIILRHSSCRKNPLRAWLINANFQRVKRSWQKVEKVS